MSADQASAMRPFFAALPGLSPAQRATAVHFGDIPSDGRGTQIAGGFQSASPSFPLVADETAGQLNQPRRTPAPPSIEPRRRPDSAGSAIVQPAPARTQSRERPAETPPAATTIVTLPTQIAERAGPPAPSGIRSTSNAPVSNPAPPAAEVRSAVLPEQAAPTIAPAVSTTIASSSPPSTPGISAIDLAPSTPVPATRQPPAEPEKPNPKPLKFADLASTIATLEDAPPAPKPTAATTAPKPAVTAKDEKKAAEDKKLADKKAAEKKAAAAKKVPPKPADPSRHWVQIAGGANKASLPREFKRLQEKAPKLLRGRSAWTAPLRATNRLLIGPFKSEGEAQAFVNQLTKAELSGFSWTSEEGQKIEKLGGT
jgi:hypothetical protein